LLVSQRDNNPLAHVQLFLLMKMLRSDRTGHVDYHAYAAQQVIRRHYTGPSQLGIVGLFDPVGPLAAGGE
jgi:hypothetical protein